MKVPAQQARTLTLGETSKYLIKKVLDQTLCEVIEALENLEKVVVDLEKRVRTLESERLSKD